MAGKNRMVFAGTYSEVITLGTGEVLQSKGDVTLREKNRLAQIFA